MTWSLTVKRDTTGGNRIGRYEPAGSLVLQVEQFAMTANLLTYAATGDALGYWSLFPAADGWGHIPAWGYARVARSDVPQVPVGMRLFGLVPMADSMAMEAEGVRNGLRAIDHHRLALNPVYNRYTVESGDAAARDANAVFRPLLIASFVLDGYVRESGTFGADTVVVTRASSKTALGFAHMAQGTARLVGLTSSRHHRFVLASGLYDEVRSYDDPIDIPESTVLLIDFSGDGAMVARWRNTLGTRCRRILRIGRTHWDAAYSDVGGSEDFFAPAHIERLVRAWGQGPSKDICPRQSGPLPNVRDHGSPNAPSPAPRR